MTNRRIAGRSIVALMSGLLLLAGLAAPSGAYQRPGTTLLATPRDPRALPDTDIGEGPGPGAFASISSNGRYVAFATSASDLVPNDVNTKSDAFLRDLVSRSTELVSVSSSGATVVHPDLPPSTGCLLGGGSQHPVVSPDGRFVVFQSDAINLVPGDTNLTCDVFVRDRKKATTERVSVATDGEQGTQGSYAASINQGGRFVAFRSQAPNLVEGDSNGVTDVFVRDRSSEETQRVSVTSDGTEANGESTNPGISANGHHVVFHTDATNLDASGRTGVFVHDRRSSRTTRVSIASDGSVGGGANIEVSANLLSANGRYVVFDSFSTNLVPNDMNGPPVLGAGDVFVHDRKTRRTERVSVTSFGEETAGQPLNPNAAPHSLHPAISTDGSYIVFESTANNLDARDTGEGTNSAQPGDQDIFVHALKTGATQMVSVNTAGEQAEECPTNNNRADGASVSLRGRYVAFWSCSPNLAPGATHRWDVFVRNFGHELGVGGFDGPASKESPDDQVCVTSDLCISPGAAVSRADATDDLDETLTEQGANLYGSSLAYRPQYGDLFAAIELEHMPKVLPGLSPIFYGLRFGIGKTDYEVRATSLRGGTFGLFDCTDSPTCTKVADLRGGYGTTGMRVVFSLPLKEIGLGSNGELSDVEAFSGLGSYLTGAQKVLDQLRIE